ncbi:helix-turn-helix transcriptional regulator [Gordonia soli]|uniref:helix-turn-helix transcriptional regulator n=1 Tax=Gordonia soli TaxID=320799 RepID=UPI00058D5C2D|nr:helix-turn-helix transcriptional regulator [Gordonia soli]
MTDDLKRLGNHVQTRRIEMGWSTREKFAEQLSVSYRVVTDLENGKRKLGKATYREVESVLDWETGSVDVVLSGGRPDPRPTREDIERRERISALRYEDGPVRRSVQTPLDERFEDLEQATRRSLEYLASRQYAPARNEMDLATSLTRVLSGEITHLAEGDQDDLDTTAPQGAPREASQDQKTRDGVSTEQRDTDNVRPLKRGNQGRDFETDPIIDEPAAAYDPPGPTDYDEFNGDEPPDPDGPEGGA